MPSRWRLNTRILPSTEPVAQRSPYVLNATACTRSLWPCWRLRSKEGFSSLGEGGIEVAMFGRESRVRRWGWVEGAYNELRVD